MKASLMDYLVCPTCHARLDLTVAEQTGDVIETGALHCTGCGDSFPVQHGLPNMLSPRSPGIQEKLREVRGWVEMSQKDGWYVADDRTDLALPYVVEKLGWDPNEASVWVANSVSFGDLLARFVRPGMRVLEVGAAKTWAGHYMVERGCQYTACDIVEDENIGVGRSRFYRERFGHYEAIVADGEHLPFTDGYFDLVFAVAALHHALNLPQMLREMARVTKTGGMVAGLNEGVRAFRASQNADVQSKEKSFGINEHVHTLLGYYTAFLRNDLWITEMTRSVGYGNLPDKSRRWVDRLLRLPLVGRWAAAWFVLGFVLPYDGITIYGRKK